MTKMVKTMDKEIIELALLQNLVDPAALLAFVEVETGGRGFDPATGRMMIQFEPNHFRKRVPDAPEGEWSSNKVERQTAEWKAFLSAKAINPAAAMESTSIGIGQIMGFHWQRLGYKNVVEMWTDAEIDINRQFWQMLQFIKTNSRLLTAIKVKDWHTVATIYNGAGYIKLAERLGREPYNISMSRAYEKYKNELSQIQPKYSQKKMNL